MPNYQNGKIYKIESLIGNCTYYGSTTLKYLSTRMAKHKSDAQHGMNITSSKVLQYDDAKIILVESYPCNDKNELTSRECYYIKNNDCVNKIIPGRTTKQYYIDNSELYKKYYDDNRNNISEYKKKYYKNNKITIDNKNKTRYHNNSIFYNRKVICECGNVVTKSQLNRHTKTEKHINYMNNPFIGSHLIF